MKIKGVNVWKIADVILATNNYAAIGSGEKAGKTLNATSRHVLVHTDGEWLSALHTAEVSLRWGNAAEPLPGAE